jgi:steroid delta-isomerase-like uncharacterized protein
MLERNKAVLRRFIEEMDKGNLDIVDEILTPDYICHLQGGAVTLDREAHKTSLKAFYKAFPDYHHRIEDLIAEGDKVVLRVTDLATHDRDFQGLPATGKKISISAMYICRFADGRIAEAWMDADLLGFYRQIGVIDEKDLEGASSFIPQA